MSTRATTSHNTRFNAGRILLLVAAALMTLNHAVIIFVLDNPVVFMGYTAFTLYALVVIAIPFRRYEKWAWYATWILPIGLAAVAALSDDPNIMPFYYAAAGVCVLGLLLTMRDFFAGNRQIAPGMS
jgi:energy-coupling factor transporter transmembrane protein EcfT